MKPILAWLLAASVCLGCGGDSTPVPPSVRDPATLGFRPAREQPRYAYSLVAFQRELQAGPGSDERTLRLDTLQGGLRGEIDAGPFFLADGTVDVRYRSRAAVRNGEAELRVSRSIDDEAAVGVAGWEDHLVLGLRMRVDVPGRDDEVYERRLHVTRRPDRLQPVVSIVEGPMLSLIDSDHPDWLVVAIETDRAARVAVEIEGRPRVASPEVDHRHEIRIDGLVAATAYRYRVLAYAGADSATTPWLSFRTAPAKGEGVTRILYGGDSRAGAGFGDRSMLGVNRTVLGRIVEEGLRRDASLLLFGGDLVSGYTHRPVDFQTELRSWKQGVLPLALTRPVYTAIGNHDTPVRQWFQRGVGGVRMDRWPYATESAEAIFAAEFVHPSGAPPALADLPSYDETVYAFTHGTVRVIVFNDNYWWTTHSRIDAVGGCPEGYVLPGQLDWIEAEVARAEADPAIRYTLLCAQEPVWPVAGHTADAMWHLGNDARRAKRWNGSEVVDLGPGMIEMRNRFWRIVANARKVPAVLTSDEHNYSRTLIGPATPVGLPGDDRDGDGKLDAPYSPNPDFRLPTWSIVSGGAGAPFYEREPIPWEAGIARFSTRFHYVWVEATAERMSLTAYALDGRVLDRVEDLMAIRAAP